MSHFLYRIQPIRAAMLTSGPTRQESNAVTAHFNYLRTLMAQGVVILAGRTLNTDSTSFGIVILNAESEAAARALVDGDPAVAGGVMSAELFPYHVALIDEKNAV